MELVRTSNMLPIALVFFGCGDHHDAPSHGWPLETAIARDLTGRFASPATARCDFFGIVPACSAEVLGVQLPIRVTSDGQAWTWKLDAGYVDTRPIAAYVDAMLGELHVKQTSSCGAVLVHVAPGERLACALSGGGSAFVEIGEGGAIRVELELDRAAAAVRAETVTPERAHELEQKSRALEHTSADEEP